MSKFRFGLAGAFAAMALCAAPLAGAQADPVVDQARAQGLVGEQTDGFLGYPSEAGVNADLRGRVNQINIRRRAVYTERAAASGASANEMAAAVVCQIYSGRIAVGERYRDEGGTWRQRTAAAPVARPSWCN